MPHKKSSILSHFHTFPKHHDLHDKANNSIFQYIGINQLPKEIQQKYQQEKYTDEKIIKIKKYPHGNVIIFYLSFIKVFFVDRQKFERCLQILYQILDDDNFTIQIPQNKESVYYTDWSVSKIKRIASQNFNQLMQNKYRDMDQLLQSNIQFSKILFLLNWSILYHSKKIQNYEDNIQLQTVKEVLFESFDIRIQEYEDSIIIPDSNILIKCLDNSYYVINIQDKNHQNITIQTIQIHSSKQNLNPFSQLRLQFQQSDSSNKSKLSSTRTQNFQDLTNTTNFNQNTSILKNINNQKTRRNSTSKFKTQLFYQQNIQNVNQNHTDQKVYNNLNLQFHNKRKQQHRRSKNKSQLEKLYQMTNRKLSTQQSLYDDPPQPQIDQYSILDQSIPTQKKVNDKIITTQNYSCIQQMTSSNQSLINKWKSQAKENSKKTQNKNKFIVNKVKTQDKKSRIQQVNQKPDFRKVKSRRRKSQDFDQNTQKVNNSHAEKPNIKESGELQIKNKNITIVKQKYVQKPEKKGKQREFYIQNPKKLNKNDCPNSKFGFVNMNISEQFTDSLILKELSQKNMKNIKQMKQKARQFRKSLKNQVQKLQQQQFKF